MIGWLEIRQWVQVNHPVHAVAISDDGQHIVAGTEQNVVTSNVTGRPLFTYPSDAASFVPVCQLATPPDLGRLYVGARQGQLIRLDLKREEKTLDFCAQTLYQADNDLYTLSFSVEGQCIAVGHLSPGLALVETDGHILWRRHPDDGTTTAGQVWSVALDTESHTLYAGSAGTGINRLVAYDASLADVTWERTFDELITALAADRQQLLVAAGIGYEGQVPLVDAKSGRILATEQVKSLVNDLDIAQGRYLAAATKDGHLAPIRYLSEESGL